MRAAATSPVVVTHLGTVDRGVLEALLAPRRAATVEVGLLLAADDTTFATSFAPALAAALDGAAGAAGPVFELRPVLVAAPYRGATVSAARLLEEGVRVIVAALPESAVRRLAPLCEQYGAALVVVGPGEEVTHDLPGVVRVTEDRVGAARALGAWAARYVEGGLFQVVSAPDAAFDVVGALRAGYEEGGAEVQGQATTFDRAAGSGAEEAVLAVRLSGARTVAVHARGTRAAELVRALRTGDADLEILLDGPMGERELAALSGRFGAVYTAAGPSATAVGRDVAELLRTAAPRLAAGSRPWSHLADLAGPGGPGSAVQIRRSHHARTTTVARTHPTPR